jgi:hypothetical protein
VGGSYQHASVMNIWWKANINQEADNKWANNTTTRSSSSSIGSSESSKASDRMMMLPITRKARLQSLQRESLTNNTLRETSSIPNDNNKQATMRSSWCSNDSSMGRKSSARRIMFPMARNARLQSHQHESMAKSTWWETSTIPNDDNT